MEHEHEHGNVSMEAWNMDMSMEHMGLWNMKHEWYELWKHMEHEHGIRPCYEHEHGSMNMKHEA
jgi:hypothetical protein